MIDRQTTSWITLICYSIVITYLSLISGQTEGDIADFDQNKIPYLDKMMHIGAYWLYTMLALNASDGKHTLPMCCLLMLHGIFLEYLQIKFTIGREASISDIIANLVGIIIGYLTVLLYRRAKAVQ